MKEIRIKKTITETDKQIAIEWIKKNEGYSDYDIPEDADVFIILLVDTLDNKKNEILGTFELSNIPFIRVAINKDKNKFYSYKSYECIRHTLDAKDIHPVMLLDKESPMYGCVSKKLKGSQSTLFTF